MEEHLQQIDKSTGHYQITTARGRRRIQEIRVDKLINCDKEGKVEEPKAPVTNTR